MLVYNIYMYIMWFCELVPNLPKMEEKICLALLLPAKKTTLEQTIVMIVI